MNLRPIFVRILRSIGINRHLSKFYYDYIHGFSSAGSELPEVVAHSLQRAITNGIAENADYCEFGIFKGHTFLQAQKAANRLGLNEMRFFGFDSFQGLPKIEGIDNTQNDEFYEGQFACSFESVRKALSENGVDWARTQLIKGFFSQTLNADMRQQLGLQKVAVALIDGDLYISAKEALLFLEPLLGDGSVLIMDDWHAFNRDDQKGERRALWEFLQRNPQWRVEPLFEYGSYGKVFELRANE